MITVFLTKGLPGSGHIRDGAKMKAYVGYSKISGSQEGAILIIAHNSREARRIGVSVAMSLFDSEFTDVRVELIKHGNYLIEAEGRKEKLARDEAHVIDDPTPCKECELWGTGELNEAGVCEECLELAESYAE